MNISFRLEPSPELRWKVYRDFSRYYYSPRWPRVLVIVFACVYLYMGWKEWKSPILMSAWLVAGLFFLEEGLLNFPLIMRWKMYRARRYYRTRPGYGQGVSYEMTDDSVSLSQEGMCSTQMSWERVTKAEERPDYFYFVGGRVFLFSCYKKYMTADQIRELRDWLVSNGKLV